MLFLSDFKKSNYRNSVLVSTARSRCCRVPALLILPGRHLRGDGYRWRCHAAELLLNGRLPKENITMPRQRQRLPRYRPNVQRYTPGLNGSLSIRSAAVKLRGDPQRSTAHPHRGRVSTSSTRPRCRHLQTTPKPCTDRIQTTAYEPIDKLRCVPNHRVNPSGAIGTARGWVMFSRACWARSAVRRLMKPPSSYRPHPTCRLLVICGQAVIWSPRNVPSRLLPTRPAICHSQFPNRRSRARPPHSFFSPGFFRSL